MICSSNVFFIHNPDPNPDQKLSLKPDPDTDPGPKKNYNFVSGAGGTQGLGWEEQDWAMGRKSLVKVTLHFIFCLYHFSSFNHVLYIFCGSS